LRLPALFAAIVTISAGPAEASEVLACGFISYTNEYHEVRDEDGPVGATDSYSLPIINSSASWYAYADYGVNKASSSTSTVPLVTSSSTSRWIDSMTLNRSDGGYGIINFKVSPSSSVIADVAYQGSADGQMTYQFQASNGGTVTQYTLTAGTLQQSETGTKDMSLQFAFNSDISLFSSLYCWAGATGGYFQDQSISSTALCNAAESVYWDGITSVTDLSGNVLSDWSLTSQSGTDC
jgi:hypothetical protein